jgi:hypothetical protein
MLAVMFPMMLEFPICKKNTRQLLASAVILCRTAW